MTKINIYPMASSINDLSNLETLIFLLIDIGRDHATTKSDLHAYIEAMPNFHNTDWRDVRRAIANLRLEHGIRICNMEDGKGFYIAADDREYREYRHKLVNRAITLYKTVKSMDAHMPQQMELDYRMEEEENG